MPLFSYSLRLKSPLRAGRAWADQDQAAVDAHLAYLRTLHRQGIVKLAGRTEAPDSETAGIVLFDAPDEEAAARIVSGDPAVAAGVMEATLRPFLLAVGAAGDAEPNVVVDPDASGASDRGASVAAAESPGGRNADLPRWALRPSVVDAAADEPGCPLQAPPFLDPPQKMPWLLAAALRLAEGRLGKRLLALRVMTWYPKALVGASLMEALVAHDEKEAPRRLLFLVRVRVSCLVSCPFCVDMNGAPFRELGIREEELAALRGEEDPELVDSFSEAERAALALAEAASRTPVRVREELARRVLAALGPRGFVIVAATAAQVNLWARTFQAMGAPSAGFSGEPGILKVDSFANPYRRFRRRDGVSGEGS